MTDPRPMLVLALDQTQAMIDTIGADDLDLPTPCPEYDVRTLLGHLMTVVARIDLALTGNDPLSIPTVTPDVADFPATWKERRATLDETLSDGSVLGRTCKLPWGTLPGPPPSPLTPASSPRTLGTLPRRPAAPTCWTTR